MNDKTRAGLSSNAKWSFRASFVKVVKTENSLHLINEDRQKDMYLYDFFSRFLGVELRNTLYIAETAHVSTRNAIVERHDRFATNAS